MERSAHGRFCNRRISQRRLRQREPEADHISRLPMDTLLKIFNLLPLESWLTMSTVSKHFEQLRTHLPYLEFDQEEIEGKIMRNIICPINGEYHHGRLPIVCHPNCAQVTKTKFIGLVDRVLHLHSGSKIELFSLCISYYESNWDVPIVNGWVNFALIGNIDEVDLHFDQKYLLNYVTIDGLRVSKTNTVSLYTLPCQPSLSKVLTILTLNACQFNVPSFGTFESLQHLNLTKVDLLDSRIEHWHSIFPMLSMLYMDRCVLGDKFFVTDKVIKIESIYLNKCMTSTWMMFPICITVQNLRNFRLCGTYLKASSITGADNLTDVCINIDYPIADRLQGSFLYSLLQDLRICQSLDLNSWCIQVLASTQSSSWEYLLQNQRTTKLTLRVSMIKQELPGICCLLRSCPLLQTLIVVMQMESDGSVTWEGFVPNVFDFEDDYWESQNMPFACLQNSLRTISILGFTGQSTEMDILKFLLQNAMVLEALHIRTNGAFRAADAVKKFERASPYSFITING